MYQLEVSRSAHRQIRRLPAEMQERINQTVARLTEDPRPHGALKLTGREGYRIRVGEYRVLYVVDDGERRVLVWRVMARREGYRVR